LLSLGFLTIYPRLRRLQTAQSSPEAKSPLATTPIRPEVPAHPASNSNPAPADGEESPFHTVSDTPSIEVKESFDSTTVGKLPADWSQWKGGGASYEVSAAKALSGAGCLASSGGSSSAGRAWLTKPLAADVEVGSAIYLNTLVPVQVLVRGT